MIAIFIVGFINLIIKSLGKAISALILLLPPSPFLVLENINIPYLEQINWIIPFDFIVGLLGYWVIAIGLYYVIQVALRWIKVIGS